MTQLVDLLNSLIKTIRVNHDTHVLNGSTLKYDTKNLDTLKETLEAMIEKSTQTYKDRLHLLNYLLHETLFIKDLLVRKTSFTPDELVKCKKELSTLLIDLRELLKTIKTSRHKVTYSHMTEAPLKIDLNGLSNGYFYCASGTVVNNEIMTPLGLTYTSEDETIAALINDLCEAHQKSLLAAETLALREELRLLKQEKGTQTIELDGERSKVVELEASRKREKEALELALEQERAKLVELEASKKREKEALELTLEQERAKLVELEASRKREKEALERALEQEHSKLVELEASRKREKEALELELQQTRLTVREFEEAARLKPTSVSHETQTVTVAEPEELVLARKRITELETTISTMRTQQLQKTLPIFRSSALLGLYNPLLFPSALAQPKGRIQGSGEALDEHGTTPESTM